MLAQPRLRCLQALDSDYYAEINTLPNGLFHFAIQLGGSLVNRYGLPQYPDKEFRGVEGTASTKAGIRAEATEALRGVRERRRSDREIIR